MALKEKYGQEVVFVIASLDNNQQSEQLAQEFRVSVVPSYFFINTKGEVVVKETGSLSYEELEGVILEHLLR